MPRNSAYLYQQKQIKIKSKNEEKYGNKIFLYVELCIEVEKYRATHDDDAVLHNDAGKYGGNLSENIDENYKFKFHEQYQRTLQKQVVIVILNDPKNVSFCGSLNMSKNIRQP